MASKEAAVTGNASSARSSHSQSSDNVGAHPQSKLPVPIRRSWKASSKHQLRSLFCFSLPARGVPVGKTDAKSGESGIGQKQRDLDEDEEKTVQNSPLNSPDHPRDRQFEIEIGEEAMGSDLMMGRVQAEPYLWPHDASLSPENTALVIIDMQRDFCMPGGYMATQGYDISPTRAIIPRIASLLQTFRAHAYPIYHTREGHRPDLSTLSPRELYRSRNNPTGFGIGDAGPMGRLLIRGEEGHDTIPELYPLATEPVIDKPGRGAFAHTDFELLLRLRGVRNLVICGVTTDVCVASTMREANDRGFDCVLVEDATAAAEEGLRVSVVQSVKEEGGIFGAVACVEDIVGAVESR